MISLFFINGKKLLLILKCRFYNLLVKKKFFFWNAAGKPYKHKESIYKEKEKASSFSLR